MLASNKIIVSVIFSSENNKAKDQFSIAEEKVIVLASDQIATSANNMQVTTTTATIFLAPIFICTRIY